MKSNNKLEDKKICSCLKWTCKQTWYWLMGKNI